jgi:glucose dehydrogenase
LNYEECKMKRTWAQAAESALLRMAPVLPIAVLLICAIEIGTATEHQKPASVHGARIANAERDPASSLTYGRTYSEQRFSPLAAINADNARRLGLAWYGHVDTNRVQEVTLLVIDGVMNFSSTWIMVKAYEAEIGKLPWSHDPQVPLEHNIQGCCDAVNVAASARMP